MDQSVFYSEGDDRFKLGQLVEFVTAVLDVRSGLVRLQPGTGIIVSIHTETVVPCANPTSPIYIDRDSPQYALSQEQLPPAILWPGQEGTAQGTGQVMSDQVRVTGFDISLTSISCWSPDEVPEYYLPRSELAKNNFVNPTIGAVSHLYIPARHVIRHISDHSQLALDNMENILFRFFRRAPYGWHVLFNEPLLSNSTGHSENTTPPATSQSIGNILENFYSVDRQRDENVIAGGIITRRIVGEVVDFGLDYDNQLKVVIKLIHPLPCSDSGPSGPLLDNFLFHGPFAETARYNCLESRLYKLPYRWIHDAYDPVHNGEQNYFNVLKHILCDTLSRYRVNAINIRPQNVQGNPRKGGKRMEIRGRGDGRPFYFGFTEDGFHFSKTNRRVLSTEIEPFMMYSPCQSEDVTKCHYGPEGYEVRQTFQTQRWLNLRPALRNEQARLHTHVKRGYIIYGRVLERSDTGQTTLEWCTPTPGLDLLRVYLVTNGQSPIFRNLGPDEILNKMKDREGNDTLASQLFLGLIDPTARNTAIDYVRRVLVWH